MDSKIAVDIPDYIARPTRSTRSYHSKRFINISSNSNTYKYNFFTRTMKEWNALLSSLLDQPSVQPALNTRQVYVLAYVGKIYTVTPVSRLVPVV